jgi:hypothetical protein
VNELVNQPLVSASPSSAHPLNDRIQQWTWILVAVGIAARVVRYLLRFPLWGDEYMLADNFLSRDFAGLLQPLEHCQVAPLVYLWSELSAVKLFGFSEWSLRLVALISSVGSVLIFRQLASRLLQGVPLLLAVGIFSVAYYPIRHGAEVKPYASDILAAMVLLALAVQWWRQPVGQGEAGASPPGARSTFWLWVLAAAAPFCIGLSFPAVFVAAGISLGLLELVGRDGRRAWLPYLAYNLAIAGSFLLVYWLSSSGQMRASGQMMQQFWGDSFPPSLAHPLEFASWFLETHTGEMFAYPIGADRGGSIMTVVLCATGIWALFSARARPLLLMAAGTWTLAFIAAAIHRYPYGGNERLVQYLAPFICLFAGVGGSVLQSRIRNSEARGRVLMASVVALALIGLGTLAHDLVRPYKYRRDLIHQGFARWFWNQEDAADFVCIGSDLKQNFFPTFDLSTYRCYQKIYSPRHHAGKPVPEQAGTLKPVRCVLFSFADFEPESATYAAWMQDMEGRYQLTSRQNYRVLIDPDERKDLYGVYQVLSFTPKEAQMAQETNPPGAAKPLR